MRAAATSGVGSAYGVLLLLLCVGFIIWYLSNNYRETKRHEPRRVVTPVTLPTDTGFTVASACAYARR